MSMQPQAKSPASAFFSDLHGEADHRVSNSLALIASLVRVRARDAATVDPAALLNEIADRIETVARLHRLMAHSASGSIELAKFLRETCAGLANGLGTKQTSIALECAEDLECAVAVAQPLGLITAELASNSFKYAHPAGTPMRIRIACREVPAGLLYAYEDDGVGFPENFDPADKANLGMRFIHALCQKLQATPQWKSDELGMRFEIVAPGGHKTSGNI